jgi:Arc/MetJ family transcription regulator
MARVTGVAAQGAVLKQCPISQAIHIRRCMNMRTNIVLDDELVEEAFRYSDAKTKREPVDMALREFVANRKRRDILELRGKALIRPDHDYKALREGR